MQESMKAVLLLLPLLLHEALAWAAPTTCVFPNFSHNDKNALNWLERRITGDSSKSKARWPPVNWPKYTKRKYRHFAVSGNTSWDEFEQYLTWLHKEDHVKSRKFFLRDTKRFNLKAQGTTNGKVFEPVAVASMDLQEKEVLLEIPLRNCISDQVSVDDLRSLHEAPWELRLAVKLLQERPKSEGSIWYYFIRLLPTIRLPLFFSESELENVEDASIISEVLSMRSFILSSFYGLYQLEIAGFTFNDFAWALAVVYSFACRLDGSSIGGSGLPVATTHLLIPFISSYNDSLEPEATVELHGQVLKVVMLQDAAEGSLLSLNYFASTSRDNFLYRGFVPTKCPHDKARVFESLQDLVEWYLSTFNKEDDKKGSLLSVHAAMQMVGHQVSRDNFDKSIMSYPDFSVGLDGYFDPYMILALNALSNSNKEMQGGSEVFEVSDVRIEGGSLLEQPTIGNNSYISSKFSGSFCIGKNTPSIDGLNKPSSDHPSVALRGRILTVLNSLSTTLEEDEAVLKASMWEGFSDDEGGSHLCETCQWQTEELSFNDVLALQYRVRKKHVLLHVLSTLSDDCTVNEDKHLKAIDIEDASHDVHTKDIDEFLKWCEAEGAQITEALTVTHISARSNLTDSSTVVRGVEALRVFEQGETICILPLKLGLFDKSSSHSAGADSWHLAAAHLLREKSLGVASKWASYINILPKTMQTPIYLMPYELHEVQWWPVLRELIQVRRAIRMSFSRLTGQELAWADFEQYRWAVIMVHSRAFTLPVGNDDEYASYVLMPFMDIINHHFEYQADWMSLPVQNGKLEIIAKRHVDKGQQIFASFGPRSNDNLFLYYGFVLENNPFDTAQLFSSFEDAVHWLVTLWSTHCDDSIGPMVTEKCTQKVKEQMWAKAQKAIDDYAAGVTEQRPEWWKLINTWADYGYEYMQFQPSPSIYEGGIIDPTLSVALESVLGALLLDKKIAFKGCTHGESNFLDVKSNLNAFFMCLDNLQWRSPTWALHSSLCSDYAGRALVSLGESRCVKTMVKVSMSLRCLDILNSFPTTILEDKRLLKHTMHTSSHVQLARQYRYIKKLFLMDFIHHVTEQD
ncbi:hypothetical protein GOP47_0014528 [Adiantum capillus-veneris]|uniref:SET domain-containing protein n=1 Tax=Adiantum capillus-veneris TaxID=13818 RepID=A0A9D4ULM8_ADICA|nr:hypothetical protein GOP47_0014528 [Adiantum capillus-veneris]